MPTHHVSSVSTHHKATSTPTPPAVVVATSTAPHTKKLHFGGGMSITIPTDLGVIPKMSDKQMNDILNNKSFKITNTGADKVQKATTASATAGSTVLDKLASLFGYNLAGNATAYPSQTGDATTLSTLPTTDYLLIGGAAILIIILMNNNN